MSDEWYRSEPQQIFDALKTSEHGLSADEAVRRLRESGPNVLPEAKTEGLVAVFFRQFQSPLIYILLVASVVVFSIGEVLDGSIILAVLVFNAFVGTIQEGRAQNTLAALKKFVETNATVLRDGQEIVIPDREVVRGDILILQEGEKIPADARIISANSLKVDEASFTGESEPVSKIIEAIAGENAPAAAQRDMVFKGTNIVSGNGRAIVTATGAQTAIGAIAKEISAIDSDIPLQANIRYLSRAIIAVVGVISAALIMLGLMDGQSFITIFTTAVALAVSIIPEGLPVAITLVLATGVWRMSKQNALVKKLQAVEALGQAEVIAVDKTGTITKNELVVREVWVDGESFAVEGVGYEPKGTVALEGAVVDAANHPELLFAGKIAALGANARLSYSEAEARWRIAGDPTEAAMLVFGEKVGFNKGDLLNESPILSEIPFDYRYKYHAIAAKAEGRNLLVVEGAPEVILDACTQIRRGGAAHPLGKKEREELEAIFHAMSERGLRVVAGAVRSQVSLPITPESVHGLTFVTFFGMQDVLRPEVAEAMARAHAAGIRVVMVTGDHPLTARAIAKEAGIWHEGDAVFTGSDVDGMTDAELAARLATATVFARVTPEDKLRIINAYKRRHETIAMTGDGVNDAPPLVAADLGVAMGKIGTEVAKEAADIILLDDNFGSIISAVEEGRSIYKTIKKVMLYLFSTSFGEAFTIIGALLLGYPLPILAVQIIWLNFVTDGFLDVSLAMEPKESGLLKERFRRPSRYLVDWLMAGRMATMALPMVLGTLFLFTGYYVADPAKAWTVSLTALAVFQWMNAWNCRSEKESLFHMDFFSNRFLLGATGIVIVLQLLAVYSPLMQMVLHTVPLASGDWVLIIMVAVSIILVEEIRKFFHRHLTARRERHLQLLAQ